MMVNFKNWIQSDIFGLMDEEPQRGTSVDHVRQVRMDVRMDPQDQTVWGDWRKTRFGGHCDG